MMKIMSSLLCISVLQPEYYLFVKKEHRFLLIEFSFTISSNFSENDAIIVTNSPRYNYMKRHVLL